MSLTLLSISQFTLSTEALLVKEVILILSKNLYFCKLHAGVCGVLCIMTVAFSLYLYTWTFHVVHTLPQPASAPMSVSLRDASHPWPPL